MKIVLMLFLFNLQACSSKLMRPPSDDFIADLKESITKGNIPDEEDHEEGIVRDFFLANSLQNSNPAKSCELYNRINNKSIYPKIFPLKDLITIKQMNVCSMNIEGARNFWKANPVENMSRWAREDYFRAAQILAQKVGDKEWYAEWTFKLSKFEKVQNDKEKYIQLSLTIAQALNLEDKFKEYQNELIKIAPRFDNIKAISDPELLYKIAYDYEKNRKFREARNFYEKIIQNDKNETRLRIKALQRIIFCYKKDRDNERYILTRKRFVHFFDTLIKNNPNNQQYQKYKVHAAFRFARAKWSRIGREESKPYIQKMLMKLEAAPIKSHGFLAQGHWILGNMMTEEKRSEEALIHFSEGLKHCQKDRSLCNNLAWAVAWAKYNQNKFDEAEGIMKSFLQKTQNRNDHQRFIFWLAKSLKNQNKMDEAEDFFKELISVDPYSYYALISYREIDEEVPEIDVDDPVRPLKNNDFEWAYTLGQSNIALKILNHNSKKIKTIEDRERIIPLFIKLGAYQSALGQFQRLPEKYRKENFGRNALYIYPFAFEDQISNNSKKFSVPYSLMASIIRQESCFNQFARSPADAFGPMQIIPEAAKLMSRKYKLYFKQTKDLYNPDVNIALGAALLRDLMNDYQFRLIPVVASYNAGSVPVKRWESERQSEKCLNSECSVEEIFEDGLKFIESIPYKETNTYVKLVYRNMVIYQLLANRDSLPLPINYFYSLQNI